MTLMLCLIAVNVSHIANGKLPPLFAAAPLMLISIANDFLIARTLWKIGNRR